MRPIRVMHVIRSLETAGMENIVRKIVSDLNPNRFEQTVCTIVGRHDPVPFPTVCLGRDPNRAAFLVPQFAKIFSKLRPDVVHSRNWAAIEAVPAARLAGVPIIVHSEHGRDVQTMGRQPWRRRWLRRRCFSIATRVFCVSDELKQYYSRELGVSADGLEVIHNGVDLGHFHPDEGVRSAMRAGLGIGPDTLLVGAVARLDPVKDHASLLRAADLALQSGLDLEVVIVGDGPSRPLLEKLLTENPRLSARVRLAGHANNIAEWLNSFDVFTLLSLSEGMSNTLLEAMATGIVPIATRVGGNPEVIEDGTSGLLVRPGDAEAISRCLLRLGENPEWRKQLAANARQQVATRFSVQRMLQRYEEMYAGLVLRKHVIPVLSRA
jgi:sugar transferase (PEP-CTERM/EpsH1 system associated)